MKVLQLVVLCLTGKVVFGKPNGAPTRTCSAMQPGHATSTSGPIPRQDLRELPYKVRAEIDGEYVRLSITGSDTVGGFLIQARHSENGEPVGKFESSPIAKYQKCNEDTGFPQYPEFSSITHKDSNPKSNITFLWSPVYVNRTENITVTFYATLAKSFSKFWVKAPSNEIYLLNLSDGAPGRASVPLWTLSSLVITFMINLLIY